MGLSIALFTRDLRVHDNPVLRAAARARQVLPLFVVDDGIGRAGYLSPNRSAFLADCLGDLDVQLRALGGRLVVRRGDVVDEVCRLASQVHAAQVHIAADVSGYAQRRQHELTGALAEQGSELVVHDGSVTAVPPGEVVPAGRDHFAVFTPYFRRWSTVRRRRPLDPPRRLSLPEVDPGPIPAGADLCGGDTSPELPAGGEQVARRRLDGWIATVDDYAQRHDDLSADATSRLSPYLHFGCLSATEVLDRVATGSAATGSAGAGSAGAEAFTRQLAWRDFHHQVLAARPEAARQDYRSRGDRWRRDDRALRAWQQGRTGYPIVDAGMRQLAAEGWMHNRARLIVASFLVKTLYLDWRLGARHFLDLLVDADIANNQLNWQWVAGTGTDTRPNRVLNPLTQAKRLDPDGAYVRRHVPELAGIAGAAVHEPWRCDHDLDYPQPLVDLDEGRDRFLAARGRG
jgi:deoxyribodipyrimidine photo-lyase